MFLVFFVVEFFSSVNTFCLHVLMSGTKSAMARTSRTIP